MSHLMATWSFLHKAESLALGAGVWEGGSGLGIIWAKPLRADGVAQRSMLSGDG